MGKIKALLDTNIVIDFLNQREPFYEQARLLMIAGRVGEFDLWISSSLIPETRERIQGLRTFVSVFAVSEREIDRMIASSWKDPEDRLLFEVALSIQADYIITRNKEDFESSLVRVLDCDDFFTWLRTDFNLNYDSIAI